MINAIARDTPAGAYKHKLQVEATCNKAFIHLIVASLFTFNLHIFQEKQPNIKLPKNGGQDARAQRMNLKRFALLQSAEVPLRLMLMCVRRRLLAAGC